MERFVFGVGLVTLAVIAVIGLCFLWRLGCAVTLGVMMALSDGKRRKEMNDGN